ncbi:hypothetical protein E4T56_gene13843, partial [Termitomyces sp. T112]
FQIGYGAFIEQRAAQAVVRYFRLVHAAVERPVDPAQRGGRGIAGREFEPFGAGIRAIGKDADTGIRGRGIQHIAMGGNRVEHRLIDNRGAALAQNRAGADDPVPDPCDIGVSRDGEPGSGVLEAQQFGGCGIGGQLHNRA